MIRTDNLRETNQIPGGVDLDEIPQEINRRLSKKMGPE
jgi:hypothetical protein